jgi:hypothetical protein
MKISCPCCTHALEICRSFIGFSVRCPSCQHPVAVPKEGEPSSTGNPPQDEPGSPSVAVTSDPDPASAHKRRSAGRVGIPVAIVTAILLSGIALIVKNAGPATTPQPPPPSEAPSPDAMLPPANTAQSK